MALPLQRTLGELRAELMARLGFAAQGAAAGNMLVMADSLLRTAQEYLYWKYEFKVLRKTYDWITSPGQSLYDWPDVMEPRQLLEVRVLFSNVWHPMEEGIEFYHDTVVDTRYFPRRYDRFAQLEIWPQPDDTYTMRGEHYQRLGRFTQDNDRCTVDDHLVFTLALGKGKRHYRHPDAQDYFEEVNNLLRKLQLASHGNKRYITGVLPDMAETRPVVVE